jgi:hypothetical protein
MDRVMADFVLDSGWASDIRELSEEAVNRCAASDGLNAGDQRAGGLGCYKQQHDTIQKSTVSAVHRRPKCGRKSTPKMDCVTSAIANRYVNSRRRYKLRLRGSYP